ncbi:MAG: mannose-1-phosphate guanylyltransferase [Tannerellaceae bacterium]|jgi:mannose-1-phosphate guanylyltransferase|nr:mannose-1-phosphate guanylyltransferase [Tannerellaceae bacterium]
MKDNYCVIMGGGIGSRFWPFSRVNYPKQFLDFFGTGRSLLQMTFDRFAEFIPIDNIYIVTNVSYFSLVKEQLPQMRESNILLEPSRRNTAPCIAYAAYHIKACNPKANIVVAPSDHLILKGDIFRQNVEKGLEFVQNNKALVTLGIKPSRPETGYGYIQRDHKEKWGEFLKVKTFTEKPNPELARIFFESGEFYWNSGLFLWHVDAILEAFAKYLPDISSQFDLGKELFNTPAEKEFIEECFPSCPNISIDYGLMEKADNVYMMCVDFGWADLGTWGSLYDLAEKDEQSNVKLKNSRVVLYDSSNNIVAIDDPARLVVIEGLDNHLVAESGNVLLICKKDNEQRIKQFIADAQLKFEKEYN